MIAGSPRRLITFTCFPVPAEKNLHALKEIMLDLPDNVCLAFVGDGPSRPSLEQHFKGMKVVFMVSPANTSPGTH